MSDKIFPNIRRMGRPEGGLAERSHVFCKLSGMVTEANWTQWTTAELEPYMGVALEAFGAHRLMFGSDWPVCRLGCEYVRWVSIVRDYAADLSESEQAALFHVTAIKAYELRYP